MNTLECQRLVRVEFYETLEISHQKQYRDDYYKAL